MERNGQTFITVAFIGVCLALGYANYDEPWRVKLMYFFPILIVYVLYHILSVLMDIREEVAKQNHYDRT